MEKAKVLSNILPQCLTVSPAFKSLMLLRPERKLRKEALPWWRKSRLGSTQLWHLMSCTYDCWELPGFHYATTLSYLRKISEWKRSNVAAVSKENQGNCKLVSSTVVAGRVMKKIFMETISKHMQDRW